MRALNQNLAEMASFFWNRPGCLDLCGDALPQPMAEIGCRLAGHAEQVGSGSRCYPADEKFREPIPNYIR